MNRTLNSYTLSFVFSLSIHFFVIGQSTLLFDEIRLTEAIDAYGVTGAGTIVAVLDRGIDYRHPDFIKPDGTTRILHIWDLSDNSGAGAANNPYGKGTFYDAVMINQALSNQVNLATRDASGHGTVTAGIAAGNGIASTKGTKGIAPEAELIIIKITSEGAPAHDGQPAEIPFSEIDSSLEDAIDFITSVANGKQMPVSLIANFGSIQGPMDGSSTIARMLDSKLGLNQPGVVFTCGTSDEGGMDNHASAQISQNQTLNLTFEKRTNAVRMDLWYHEDDDIEFEILSPGANFGPYTPVISQTDDIRDFTSNFNYYNLGSSVDFFGSNAPRRELLLDVFGPNGTYTIRMKGLSINAGGRFDAILNLSWILGTSSEFTSHIEPGYTIWDLASAHLNICPNSYILRDQWQDYTGVTRSFPGDDNGVGSLWLGSGIGPTHDGRIGVDISVPGNVNFGAYGPDSFFATIDGNIVEDDQAMYGVLAAVSGANPVLAGVIALMLEIDPTLTADEVKSILRASARTDSFTGTVPNTSWGFGKLDVYAALELVSKCPVNRDLTIDHQASVTIYAENAIESRAVTRAPFSITYKAGNHVLLLEDFEVVNGSTFLASIEDCTN